MLTWMGLVGKLIDLIVTKVAGKKIDLALDEKKKAAKAFVKFYEATFRLETILAAFLSYAERFTEREGSTKPAYKIIYEKTLKETLRDLPAASSNFVKSMAELGKVLYFFDKAVATLFAEVFIGKMDLLRNVYYFFAQSIEAEVAAATENTQNTPLATFRATSEPGNQFGSWSGIEFTIPSDTLMDLDFNEQFDTVVANHIAGFHGAESRDTRASEYYHLQNSVITIIESNLEMGYVGPTDKDKLIELCGKLKTHKKLLTEAREKLRDFIQAQFTLSDILSVTR